MIDYNRIPGKIVYEPAWVEKYTKKQEESFIEVEKVKKEEKFLNKQKSSVLDSLCKEDSKMLQYLHHEGCLQEEINTTVKSYCLFKIGKANVEFSFYYFDNRASIKIDNKKYHTLEKLIDEIDKRNHWLYGIL